MSNAIIGCIYFLLGICFSVFLFHPLRTWKEGYEDAKSLYGDWNKGFDTGYEAAKRHHTNYAQGFKAGYHAAKRELEVNKDETD